MGTIYLKDKLARKSAQLQEAYFRLDQLERELAAVTAERDALVNLCERANELLGIAHVCMDGWERARAWHQDYKALDAAKGVRGE